LFRDLWGNLGKRLFFWVTTLRISKQAGKVHFSFFVLLSFSFALSHSPGFVGWTVCLCTVGGIFFLDPNLLLLKGANGFYFFFTSPRGDVWGYIWDFLSGLMVTLVLELLFIGY
jgi:hypothetical protein